MIEDLLFAIIIVVAWSIVYKDNPLYQALENILIGLTLGISLYEGLISLNSRLFIPIFVNGKWLSGSTIALIFGLLMFTRFFSGTKQISRLPIALMSGVGTAIAVKGAIGPMIIQQISVGRIFGVDFWTGFNNFLMILATLTTMSYFLFTFTHTGFLKYPARIGRFSMMMSFAVSLAGMVHFITADMTGFSIVLTTYPGYYILALAIVMIAASVVIERSKN